MRRVALASFFFLVACSAGGVAQPSAGEPAAAATAQELGRCDALGAPNISAQMIHDCVSRGREEARCMEPFFAEYLKTHTTKDALALLQCYQDTDVGIRDACHPVSHAIGRQTMRIHETVDRSFNACDQTCMSGCYHGVMERFLRGDGDEETHLTLAEIESKAATACDSPASQAMKGQCWHGLGHAIMFYTGYALKPSLSVCDSLKEGVTTCFGGVFMENVVAADPTLRDLSDTDYHYPCDVLDERYQNACYLMQTSRMVEMGLTPPQILAECQKAGNFRIACIQSLGRDMAYHAVRGEPRETSKVCELGVGDDRLACLTGVVNTLVSDHGDGRYAFPYCESYASRDDALTCFHYAMDVATTTTTTSYDLEAQCMIYARSSAMCLAAAAATNR
jgi:hypothetical protein